MNVRTIMCLCSKNRQYTATCTDDTRTWDTLAAKLGGIGGIAAKCTPCSWNMGSSARALS